MSKKSRKLTVCLEAKVRDFFGVWEVSMLINGKPYIYVITSEPEIDKIEFLIKTRKDKNVRK